MCKETRGKPYKFIGFGAIDANKNNRCIVFGAIDGTKSYKFIGSGAIDVTKGVRRPIEFVRIPRIDRSRILGPTGGVAEPL